jgi:hypothetical protein
MLFGCRLHDHPLLSGPPEAQGQGPRSAPGGAGGAGAEDKPVGLPRGGVAAIPQDCVRAAKFGGTSKG